MHLCRRHDMVPFTPALPLARPSFHSLGYNQDGLFCARKRLCFAAKPALLVVRAARLM